MGYRAASGDMQVAGTVFFVSYQIDQSDINALYAITAKHVVDAIRTRGDGLHGYYRINMKDGTAKWVQFDLSGCVFHPDDPSVDVALVPAIGTNPQADMLYYDMAGSLTDAVISEQQVGPGEEVFVTGLFVSHFGRERNIPIIRTGNIAAMPEEPIETASGLLMDAYLVEARSIGGLSGSPVFANLGIVRALGGAVKHATKGVGIYYLMGLMHGHFDVTAIDENSLDALPLKERVNMGIAIVVPVGKILEVITQPRMKDERERLLREREAEPPPLADSAS